MVFGTHRGFILENASSKSQNHKRLILTNAWKARGRMLVLLEDSKSTQGF
jgi:hypothetical protein